MASAPKFPVVQIADSSGNLSDSVTGTPSSALPVTQPTPVTVYTEATTARTTSSQTGTLTWPAGVTRAFVGVNLTALTGGTTPTVTVNIQQMDANGNWITIASTAALNAVGVAQLSVGQGHTAGAVVLSGGSFRISWTVTGGPATCSFQVGITAR